MPSSCHHMLDMTLKLQLRSSCALNLRFPGHQAPSTVVSPYRYRWSWTHLSLHLFHVNGVDSISISSAKRTNEQTNEPTNERTNECANAGMSQAKAGPCQTRAKKRTPRCQGFDMKIFEQRAHKEMYPKGGPPGLWPSRLASDIGFQVKFISRFAFCFSIRFDDGFAAAAAYLAGRCMRYRKKGKPERWCVGA